GEQRTDLRVAGGLDLLGEAGYRQLAVDLRHAAHAARAPPEADALAASWLAARVRRAGGGLGENRAARPIECAGGGVQDVDEPARDRAELLLAGADTAVDRGRLRGGEAARELAGRPCAGPP